MKELMSGKLTEIYIYGVLDQQSIDSLVESIIENKWVTS